MWINSKYIVFIKYTEVRSRYHPDKEGMLVSDGLSLGEAVPGAPAGPRCGRKILKWNLPNHPCWRWCRLFFCKAVSLINPEWSLISVQWRLWTSSLLRVLCPYRETGLYAPGQQMLLSTCLVPRQCAGCWRLGENGLYKPNSLQRQRGFLSPYLCLSLGFAVPDWDHFLVLLDGSWLYCMELGGPDSGKKAGEVGSCWPSALGSLLSQVGSCGRGFGRVLSLRGFCRSFSEPSLPIHPSLFTFCAHCTWRVCL